MSGTETSPPQRPSVKQKQSTKIAPKDIEKSSHDENAIRQASYMPQSDEEYNVTFKTWIVVWVSIGSLSLAPSYLYSCFNSTDSRLVLWYLILDRPDSQRMSDWSGYTTRRCEPTELVHPGLHNDR